MESMKKRANGWQDEETRKLLDAVKLASESGRPLRNVFEELSGGLGRKPNSIRNHYYACLRENPEAAGMRPMAMRLFTPEETHELLRQVLMAKGQGISVRACVMRMAEGDRSRMLRYQNKYRAILRHRPDMLESVRQELESEGLPCPPRANVDQADAAFCDPEDPAATALMAEPCVAAMLEGLKELLHRAAQADERLRSIDRLRVQNDLHRIAWEKDFARASGLLGECVNLLRDTLEKCEGCPENLREAVADCITRGEAFLAEMPD